MRSLFPSKWNPHPERGAKGEKKRNRRVETKGVYYSQRKRKGLKDRTQWVVIVSEVRLLRAKQCALSMKKRGGVCTVYLKILIAVEDWWNLEAGELY